MNESKLYVETDRKEEGRSASRPRPDFDPIVLSICSQRLRQNSVPSIWDKSDVVV